jgi:N-acyl-D-aspartate/D-glutamate deacylase
MRPPIVSISPILLMALILAAPACAEVYDVVLEGGRVMDPETGMDAIRNVGITQGRITRIAADKLAGRRVLDAAGLVVAPGFIDLHQHGQDAAGAAAMPIARPTPRRGSPAPE